MRILILIGLFSCLSVFGMCRHQIPIAIAQEISVEK